MSSPHLQEAATKPVPKVFSPSERKRLVSLAYGYLGSLTEAEDMVQEALLRLTQTDYTSIHNAEAWVTTVVTRLSIDRLRSAQHRRETYPGEWLPEPVFGGPSQEQEAITRSRLSVGLLYLLEKLEPEQRVVFVLRDVFERAYASIAEITGKSEAACRQLMVRARAALERARRKPPIQQTIDASLANRFIEALAHGDEGELLGILAEDAVLVSDGGGKVPATLKPIYGADRIKRFFLGIRQKNANVFEARPAMVNSGSGALFYRDGQLTAVAALTIENGRITAIYSVNNPDKIRERAGAPPVDRDGLEEANS